METAVRNPLENLVKKLELRNTMKRDFIVPSSKMHWANGDLCINTTEADAMIFKPTELFETQIADKLGIPNPYFRKMKSLHPDLLQQNVNGWLAAKQLSWQQGFPSRSECPGQEGQLIPELHDPLLNDPDVLH